MKKLERSWQSLCDVAEQVGCWRCSCSVSDVVAVPVWLSRCDVFSLATALHLQLDVFVTQQAQRDHSRRLTDASHSYGHFLHTL